MRKRQRIAVADPFRNLADAQRAVSQKFRGGLHSQTGQIGAGRRPEMAAEQAFQCAGSRVKAPDNIGNILFSRNIEGEKTPGTLEKQRFPMRHGTRYQVEQLVSDAADLRLRTGDPVFQQRN